MAVENPTLCSSSTALMVGATAIALRPASLRPKPVGSNEIAMPTQRFKMPKPSVDSLNHFLFPIQACARGHFVAGPENGASRLLNHEMAFQFSEANVTTAVTQGLGE